MLKKLLFLSFIIFFRGCDSNILPPTNGPCIHEYKEPILTINSVTSEITGEEITEITIRDLLIDNLQGDLVFFEIMISENITVQDSLMTCTMPCAFATEIGEYQFKVSAFNYQNPIITTNACYNEFEGGCPSYADNGTEINFRLKPL